MWDFEGEGEWACASCCGLLRQGAVSLQASFLGAVRNRRRRIGESGGVLCCGLFCGVLLIAAAATAAAAVSEERAGLWGP